MYLKPNTPLTSFAFSIPVNNTICINILDSSLHSDKSSRSVTSIFLGEKKISNWTLSYCHIYGPGLIYLHFCNMSKLVTSDRFFSALTSIPISSFLLLIWPSIFAPYPKLPQCPLELSHQPILNVLIHLLTLWPDSLLGHHFPWGLQGSLFLLLNSQVAQCLVVG